MAPSGPATAACDLCRRMKIKCERKGSHCDHCLASNAACTFAPAMEKKPLKMKRPEQLSCMEQRIERMEAILKTSGLGNGVISDPRSFDDIDEADLADRFSSLIVTESGESKYIGSASSFSLLSPRGVQWITEKIGSQDFQTTMADISKCEWASWEDFQTEVYQRLPEDKREPCPDRPTATRYIDFFFKYFNNIYPLYDRPVFDSWLERQFSDDAPSDTTWYASFNIVLAIGSMLEQMWKQGSENMGYVIDQHHPCFSKSWRYFKNASSTFLELTFTHANLMATQAMIAMAFMMQSTPDPHETYTMTAAATRMAQRLGLHASIEHFSLTREELEQRRNVFWIAFILDKGVCIRSGCPPTLHDEDIGIRLPDPRAYQLKYGEGSQPFSLFRSRAELALIEGKVYSELYSARSRLQGENDRLHSVGALDAELEQWKNKIPVAIRPGHDIQCDQNVFMAFLMLHFAYYDCSETIHRASSHHQSWFNEKERASVPSNHPNRVSNPRVYASTSIGMNAARSMIRLMRHFTHANERPRESLSWVAVYYPLSASLTLFANIVRNPDDPSTESDIDLMRLVSDFLSKYMASDWSRNASTGKTIRIVKELTKTAVRHVEDVRSKSLHKAKRSRTGSLPIETSEATTASHNACQKSSRATPKSPSTCAPDTETYQEANPVSCQILSASLLDVAAEGTRDSAETIEPSISVSQTANFSDEGFFDPMADSMLPNASGPTLDWDLENLWNLDGVSNTGSVDGSAEDAVQKNAA